VALLPGLAAAVGVGLVSWWVIGDRDTGDDYVVGPFNLPAWVAPTVGWAGLLLLMVAVVAVWVPVLRRGPRLAGSTAGLLCIIAVAAAGAWRVVTAGVVGANIGAGVVALLGPSGCSVLLAVVAFVEGRRRGRSGRALAAVAALTALLGPAISAVLVLTV
jgi:hypothetical protein